MQRSPRHHGQAHPRSCLRTRLPHRLSQNLWLGLTAYEHCAAGVIQPGHILTFTDQIRILKSECAWAVGETMEPRFTSYKSGSVVDAVLRGSGVFGSEATRFRKTDTRHGNDACFTDIH